MRSETSLANFQMRSRQQRDIAWIVTLSERRSLSYKINGGLSRKIPVSSMKATTKPSTSKSQ